MGKLTFRKEERLSKEKLIQELFDKGSSFYLYPFKVYYMPNPDQDYPCHQIMISVSKRNFKRAVDRNLIKRRIREAYRINKGLLPVQNKLVIAYIYSVKDILPSAEIQERLVKTFKRLEHVEKI
ncbi:MAG: ribonuclease P protein component [Cyclobacteriaceae bacterium]|nr:ribonuclease P protein component [Cyclobacteriaceae bacterium]MDH4298319.1 ribonuclease P protein component [Cyclobacteriaceae bacterium]MDH5251436.1 ribonuclease P protein component [Cyclobacteriaceae bacterium]